MCATTYLQHVLYGALSAGWGRTNDRIHSGPVMYVMCLHPAWCFEMPHECHVPAAGYPSSCIFQPVVYLQGGRAQRIEMLLLHEFHARKYILPDKASYRDRDAAAGGTQGTTGAKSKAGKSGKGAKNKAKNSGECWPPLFRAH